MRTRRVGAKDLSTIAHTTRKEGLSVNREEKRVQITRREVLQGLAATGTAAALSTARMFANPISGGADSVNHDALGAVDILLGTGGHGHCYPGATVPFGAVQLSPDTFNDGWDWCSGYHLSDS